MKYAALFTLLVCLSSWIGCSSADGDKKDAQPTTFDRKSHAKFAEAPIPPPADVAAPPASAEASPSGLAWVVLQPGTGTIHPKKGDSVEVHYVAWSTDGKMVDSNRTRALGYPATIRLDGVIEGWMEGIPMMVVGESRRLWVPAKLAYGEAEGTMVFDIELLFIR